MKPGSWLWWVVCFVLLAGVFAPAAEAAVPARTPILIAVEDDIVSFPDEKPFVEKGQTFVPVRFFSDAMGISVGWDNAAKKVTLTKDGKTMGIETAGDRVVMTDGTVKKQQIPLQNGRTLLPYRLITESFGYAVQYYPEGPAARVYSSEAALSSSAFLAAHKSTFDAFRKERDAWLEKQKQSSKKPLYVTFDDGPNKYTASILNQLKKEDAKATFFVLAGNAKRYPDLIRRMQKEGHEVACHGVTHQKNVFYASPKMALQEMNTCAATVKSITGEKPVLVRSPYGSKPYLTPRFSQALHGAGYRIWDWNVDTRDWASKSPQEVWTRTASALKNVEARGQKPVVLMHDNSITVQSLPRLLTTWEKAGYRMDPLDASMKPYFFWDYR